MQSGFLIMHVVVALAGLRLALFCGMQWRLLRIRRAVIPSPAGRWDQALRYLLPALALLMAVLVVNSLFEVIRLLGGSAA